MNGRPGQRAGGSALAPFDGMAMELKLYDTLAREKRAFVPIDPHNVRMYVCGPTVYDFAHIGNARPVIVFDVLFRLLRHLYGADHVTYVRNITDVDDKINARAAERGIPIRELTEETYANYKADVAALGCLPPTVEPRATEHIAEMKALTERLVAAGHAYVADDHVLFDVPSMPDYGRLAHRTLEEMIAGARVDPEPYKRDPMDFVLWKPSKPGEPAWPSPCGIASPGRPGWHIECSAMSWKHLGETFDIHGGGIDLVFPHHENEIAQSRCAFHTPVMANYWMHNGFLQVEGEKMSKSLGNFLTIWDLRETEIFGGRRWNGNVLRAAMLQAPYRQPIDWTVKVLEQAEARIERWTDFAAARTGLKQNPVLLNSFVEVVADDLDTPAAFLLLDHVVNSETPTDEDRFTVFKILKLMGFDTQNTEVAKIATRFRYLRNAISKFSQRDWEYFSAAADQSNLEGGDVKPEARLLASMQALEDIWRSLENKNIIGAEHHSWKPPSRESIAALAKRFEDIIKALGRFSQSDWDNFSVTVVNRPIFKGGNPKPEAKLFDVIKALIDDWHAIESRVPFSSLNSSVKDLKDRLVKSARPAKSEFETRVRRLVLERDEARKSKNFAESDRIRDELLAMGVVLKDSKDGTTWELAR
jgi:cysteinyl-tRNA synthetase